MCVWLHDCVVWKEVGGTVVASHLATGASLPSDHMLQGISSEAGERGFGDERRGKASSFCPFQDHIRIHTHPTLANIVAAAPTSPGASIAIDAIIN